MDSDTATGLLFQHIDLQAVLDSSTVSVVCSADRFHSSTLAQPGLYTLNPVSLKLLQNQLPLPFHG